MKHLLGEEIAKVWIFLHNPENVDERSIQDRMDGRYMKSSAWLYQGQPWLQALLC
jgi:hypothetical protein